MKIINLLVGGPQNLWPDNLKNGRIDGDWIGVDRGSYWLIKKHINPIVAIGDFDSMDENEFRNVKAHVDDLRSYDPIKDYTDTQLAVKIATEFKPDVINIYGATGGRLDHFMSNILIPTELSFHNLVTKIRIIDCQNTIQYFLPGYHDLSKESGKKYLAFIPLNAMTLSIYDAKYKLNNKYVSQMISYSSNEFVKDRVTFEFDKGVLCVIQSCDK